MKKLMLIALLAASVTTAMAADLPERKGFGANVGVGVASISFPGCDCDNLTAGAFNFRLGGFVSEHQFIGFESTGLGAKDSNGEQDSIGFYSLVTQAYFSKNNPLFLKANVGAVIEVYDGYRSNTAVGYSLGLGVDTRVGKNTLLTTSVEYVVANDLSFGYGSYDVRAAVVKFGVSWY